MLITLDDIKFSYKDEIVLENLSGVISDTDRIGLIGENGSGKTTLLNILVGRLTLDGGGVFRKKALSVGYLEQNSGLESESTVMDEMRECFSDLLKMEERMRELEIQMSVVDHESREFSSISSEYNRLKKGFEGLDGYNIDVKIKTVLSGLGFLNVYDRVVRSFSGGEKTRLAIAKLLLQNPELLILDEPTNHLDFATLAWLEGYLKNYKGALLIVSHDRFFLDKTVERIWELENKKINDFKGNYTKYKKLKADWILLETKEYEKQQVQIAKMEDFVARNRYLATKAKSAQSRVKALEKMERIEKPSTFKKKPKFAFHKPMDPTKTILSMNALDLFAGEKELLNSANFEIMRGDKVAIIGENGAGKSTLLKRIVNSFGSEEDCLRFGKNILLSYYDQENLNLNFDNRVIDEMWDKFPRSDIFKIRQGLGRMLFEEVDLDKKISVLSGGERARLGFSILMMKEANFLILDEPTNHIDLETRESLEEALKEFDGSVLFVSHDRYFLQQVATKIVEIKDKKTNEFNGGFSEYLENMSDTLTEERTEQESPKKEKKGGDYRSARERKESAKSRIRLKELEEEIAVLESRKEEINENILKEENQKDYSLMKIELDALSETEESLAVLYDEWEELFEKTEN